jgi:hypothetical protein
MTVKLMTLASGVAVGEGAGDARAERPMLYRESKRKRDAEKNR